MIDKRENMEDIKDEETLTYLDWCHNKEKLISRWISTMLNWKVKDKDQNF